MRFALRLAVLASCATAAPLAAQSTAFYLTDGDANRGFIVQNGAVQSTFSLPKVGTNNNNSQYALRFQGDNFLVARRQGQQAIEYNSAGVATGQVYNYSQNFDQLLDGATDGQFTYSARCCNGPGGIIRGDINFGGMAQLGTFTAGLSGITYAASRNSLFATDFGESLFEFSLSGTLLNTYTLNTGNLGALAYEASTNTLWGAINGTSTIRQYSLAGVQLASINVTGGLAGNVWGGEMRGAATVVPEPSTYALLATGFLALVGVARRRRSA